MARTAPISISLISICVATLLTGTAAGASATSGSPNTTVVTVTANRAKAAVSLPLRTQGTIIVDRSGQRVKLASVNWFGAESGEFVVGGLDKQPLSTIVGLIRDGGFNSVRLPWSNELVESNPVVEETYLTANPSLQGKHALEILDAVIDELGRAGLLVILDNHRSRGDWCCDQAHGDGLWYTAAYPESAWLADWTFMAARYRNRSNVVGAELRNEIRPDPSLGLSPTWGGDDPATDWRAAAIKGAEAVLSINPNLLIIVGNINYNSALTEIPDNPITLSVSHRLVYAAHDYVWFHSDAATDLADDSAFAANANSRWGMVLEPGHPWSAPVYISEWGGCTQVNTDGSSCSADRLAYPYSFIRYAAVADLDWAWWPINGTQSSGYSRTRGATETYGLLTPAWDSYANADLLAALQTIQKPTVS